MTYAGKGKTSESFLFRRSFNDFFIALTFIVLILYFHSCVAFFFDRIAASDSRRKVVLMQLYLENYSFFLFFEMECGVEATNFLMHKFIMS